MQDKLDQIYIYKINSERLKLEKWNIHLDIDEAIKSNELVPLSDSQTLTFIREITNNKISIEDVRKVRCNIDELKEKETNLQNRKAIKEQYNKLYRMLYEPNYVSIIINNGNVNEYDKVIEKANKTQLKINNKNFRRLVGTPGGSKKDTIVFVSEDVYSELDKRLNNDRDKKKKLIAGKLESYKALSCSASISIGKIENVLVVPDCENKIETKVITLDDSENNPPIMKTEEKYEMIIDGSDGCGMISPELSKKISKKLGEDYIIAGYCIRNAFCKGMLFTFDFKSFGENIAKNNKVIDAWGNEKDINKIDIVLTTSMLKLWDSYSSIEDYLNKCDKNGYTFRITKHTPKQLDNERNLNYQFIQSLHLNDEDIEKLIEPTINEIKDILNMSPEKAILYLKGIYLNDKKVLKLKDDCIKGLMINQNIIQDTYVRNYIYNMIRNRIDEAKTGVLKVHGNFSIASGDLYALCQSMFGMEITGLLSANHCYSKYWNDYNTKEVAVLRAPMTCENNIRKLELSNTEEMQNWYQYMNTVLILNIHDATMSAENGEDFDGDLNFTTDNKYFLKGIADVPPIVCLQKKAESKIVKEEDLINANKNAFGNSVGTITNRITSMFERRSEYDEKSKEYKELSFRICCGQNYQQNSLDKVKGIIAKEMPPEWYSPYAVMKKDNDSIEVKEQKEFNKKILANKKPYFMIYIYPKLKKQYENYIKLKQKECRKNFNIDLNELLNKKETSHKENIFVKNYYRFLPTGNNACIINKICWKIENEFKDFYCNLSNITFDYSILKSNRKYNKKTYNKIKTILEDYIRQVIQYKRFKNNQRDNDEKIDQHNLLVNEYKKNIYSICNNSEELCNIMVDICYKENKNKQYMWDIVGTQIIKNLLVLSNNKIKYPYLNVNGNIQFRGQRFSIKELAIKEESYE